MAAIEFRSRGSAAVSGRAERGFSLIEVLTSIMVTAVGVLGVAALQGVGHLVQLEAYQRAQAVVLMNDMVERINVNRGSASCLAFTTDTTKGIPYLGAAGANNYAPSCTSGTNPDMAVTAMTQWNSLLRGGAESVHGGGAAGAMTGARGCVTFDATTGIYTIAVAWQGQSNSAAPTVNCAKNLYGSEAKRRVVSTTLQIANLK